MLGLISMFAFLIGSAVTDHISGRIPLIFLIPPIAILGAIYPMTFLRLFVPLFIILLFTYEILARTKWKNKPNSPLKIGFGDVLATPLALSIVSLLHPFIGPTVFTICLAAELPLLHRRKNIRFVPWLLAPVAMALIVSLIF